MSNKLFTVLYSAVVIMGVSLWIIVYFSMQGEVKYTNSTDCFDLLRNGRVEAVDAGAICFGKI